MSQLAEVLRRFYKQSNYRSVAALTESARNYTSISQSYVKQLMSGLRQRPAFDKTMAVARALDLSRRETNELLKVAGHPPLPESDFQAATPQLERIIEALNQLRQTPGVSAEAFEMIANGVVTMVAGIRAALGAEGDLAVGGAEPAGSTVRLRELPAAALSPEEGMLDDLLGDMISRSDESPLDEIFAALETVAQADRWEPKRRITEALPQLVQMQPAAALRIANILRNDYHPDYRADIRRRVVEAVPALYRYRAEESLALLALRQRDEVYIGMAILEALHDLVGEGRLSAEVAAQYRQATRFEDSLHQAVIVYLSELLSLVSGDPEAALARLLARREDPERLIKIVIQRIAPRLLSTFPVEILDLMRFFLRRNDDEVPVEHQNIRRPVSRALPDIFALLPDAAAAVKERIGEIVPSLARDPDIHVRRALGDVLDRLTGLEPDLAVQTMDILIADDDPYVRQRTWHALLQLAEQAPEKAEAHYLKLLTLGETVNDS